MEELKACPFCGGEAKTYYQMYDLADWCVQCDKCGATHGGYYNSEQEAITAWNTRADGENK